MTAMKIKVGAVPRGKPTPIFLDLFCRSLIILCTFLSVILSSVAVCDGHWMLAGRRMFGLWYFCSLEEEEQGSQSFKASSNCTRHLEEAGVDGLGVGLAVCRSVITLAVVSAIFGLELLVMSQVSEGRDSSQRWTLGARLVLLAGVMAAGGVATFVLLLRASATLLGFTLTFWCQFTATFLFFLSGMAAQHIQHIEPLLPFSGHPEKV
ncbi:Voltage-dependent calcium channel gamma-like subunit [Labeo rohita]|uniref:Voltage-dependent calcium channel gamma-like subunit n=1 Tax=Labeo rohita TaxID=84645 RepID=A0ABQ8MBZ2_LABRO|nr:voltage-dependent calcium channel gamma-like subunit [Labeo rohita]KAI2660399.1 Voltage-dependent calcium channel gamma-like subunit [Labeo rohita]